MASLRGLLRRILPARPGRRRFGIELRHDRALRERYFALNDLDRKIEPYLDFRNGFFIEAGANDGVSQSNTLHFERHRGWQGLLVEPVPALARRCRAVRPRSLTVNSALGAFDQRGGSVNMTYVNLMSVVDGAMRTREEQEAHIDVGSKIQKLDSYALTVPVTPLSDLIDRYGIGRVDLLSLDVEGYEATALRGIDYARHRPRFMLIEARYRDNIEAVIGAHYRVASELNERDILYAARTETDVPYAQGWTYRFERGLAAIAALPRLYPATVS